MNFLEKAQSRYTTKVYRNEKISADKIADLQQILRLSPSSINSQPWQFIFVSDEKIKNRLAAVSMVNEDRVKQASHLVVFCSFDNLQDYENQMDTILPKEWAAFYYQVVKAKGNVAAQSWIEKQVYLSMGYFLAACAGMDIDATPMEGIFPEKYDQILGIEKGYKTLCAVLIGYRDEKDENQPDKTPKQRLELNKIIKTI
ncbi:nitroreductase family protein [Capnocytophaga sp.]|uniref:nitroreductase family protein n=1 Tax=Capnocytophaga sp. TaxID=44737 RepID=UPI0026DD47BF|nr:nitroreductase family protein [Capnocytophaga sp.]MDO5106447.1 nitroreductase family protein [Capnocytophaga sp.]